MSDFCFLARYSRKRRYLNSKVPHQCCLFNCIPFRYLWIQERRVVFSRLCSLMREGRVDTKKPLFPKFSWGRTPLQRCWKCVISYANIRLLFFKLDWKALCTGGYKLNPFALPHGVVARARRLELRRTVKVQHMALHNSLFHMTSDVAKIPFLIVSDHVGLKLGCV